MDPIKHEPLTVDQIIPDRRYVAGWLSAIMLGDGISLTSKLLILRHADEIPWMPYKGVGYSYLGSDIIKVVAEETLEHQTASDRASAYIEASTDEDIFKLTYANTRMLGELRKLKKRAREATIRNDRLTMLNQTLSNTPKVVDKRDVEDTFDWLTNSGLVDKLIGIYVLYQMGVPVFLSKSTDLIASILHEREAATIPFDKVMYYVCDADYLDSEEQFMLQVVLPAHNEVEVSELHESLHIAWT